MYQQIIKDATGETASKRLGEIERVMRGDNGALSGFTKAQLRQLGEAGRGGFEKGPVNREILLIFSAGRACAL